MIPQVTISINAGAAQVLDMLTDYNRKHFHENWGYRLTSRKATSETAILHLCATFAIHWNDAYLAERIIRDYRGLYVLAGVGLDEVQKVVDRAAEGQRKAAEAAGIDPPSTLNPEPIDPLTAQIDADVKEMEALLEYRRRERQELLAKAYADRKLRLAERAREQAAQAAAQQTPEDETNHG